MKALVIENKAFKMTDMPEIEPEGNEVKIKMTYVGLNRRDTYMPKNRQDQPEALIVGSDGAGVIEAVGEDVTHFKVGDEVIINPSLNWFEESAAPPKDFQILGHPDHGTFAEKVTIDAGQVEPKPGHLSDKEAATIALASLTGYRAMFTQGKLEKGQTVFIPGGSSGVSQFLIQFAIHSGARVITSSRHMKKRAKLQELGAHVVLDTAEDWEEALKEEPVDLVIESVGGATFNRSLATLKQGGRMVVFGSSTEDTVDINIRQFFYGQYQLIGSTMGSREELREALAFIERHQIKPEIGHEYVFDDLKVALDDLVNNKYFGKITVKVN